jgi:hypothetical protein
MTRPQVEEIRPLLQRSERLITRTPLPWDQFWIILFLQLSDPLALQTLAPFIPQVSVFLLCGLESDHILNIVKLVRDIGVTHGDESLVGHYVGILVSMPSFSVCSLSLSDTIPSIHLIIPLKH